MGLHNSINGKEAGQPAPAGPPKYAALILADEVEEAFEDEEQNVRC